MRNNKQIYRAGVLSLVFGILVVMAAGNVLADGLPPLTHSLTSLDKGTPAPALHLLNIDEDKVDLKDLKGKVVVVNFWATWCPPCRREMASLERLHQAGKDKNLVVLAVNVGEDEDTVMAFTGTVEPMPEFAMLLDADAEAVAAWKVRGLPTTYIVAPDGSLAYRAVGGREFDHPEMIKSVLDLAGSAAHQESGP